MAQVRRLGKVKSTMVESRLCGDGLTYEQVDIEPYAYACTACGKAWDRKAYAEKCESRGCVANFTQEYHSGGAVVNGRFTGRVTVYTRSCLVMGDMATPTYRRTTYTRG